MQLGWGGSCLLGVWALHLVCRWGKATANIATLVFPLPSCPQRAQQLLMWLRHRDTYMLCALTSTLCPPPSCPQRAQQLLMRLRHRDIYKLCGAVDVPRERLHDLDTPTAAQVLSYQARLLH